MMPERRSMRQKLLLSVLCASVALLVVTQYRVSSLFDLAGISPVETVRSEFKVPKADLAVAVRQRYHPELIQRGKHSTVDTSAKAKTQLDQKHAHPERPYESHVKLPQYHVVFSTSCNEQMHWESLVFFYHAHKVKQRGTVTRILSGCESDHERDKAVQFFDNYIKPMSPDNFFLHLTPDYSRLKLVQQNSAYKYMNKPFGVRHWLENGLGLKNRENLTKQINSNDPDELLDGIIFLLDPDMILLRPITHDFSDRDSHVLVEDDPATFIVRHGKPMSMQDGYLNNEWRKVLNMSYITQKPRGQFVPIPEWQEGPVHYNAGPPYIFTVKDGYKIALKWTEYAPRVLDLFPRLFGEMYAYIAAIVQLRLPHTMIKSLVVSDPDAMDREAWPFIDALPNDHVCDRDPPTNRLPVALHYCKRYLIGKEFFSKYRVKKNIMNCEKALLKAPVPDLFLTTNVTYDPPREDKNKVFIVHNASRQEVTWQIAKRHQYMLCGLIGRVNEALRYLKQISCVNTTANYSEVYTVHNDPSNY